jgi:hypothetical protein
MLLMAACCLIPIGLIVGLSVLAIPASGLTTTVIALMCPAMMLFMLFGMRGDHAEHHEHHHAVPTTDKKQISNSLDQ